MTELYIDKQLVVLPETFSITIIDENPFFTKNGKYTYDISISLLDPINARIYKHLNRINRKGDVPVNRSAYLVVDNEVVLNGTEVILEYTESQVKIQLVSGNSELNFLIGGDLKLRDLDLGKAYIYEDIPESERFVLIFQDLKKTYPERDWQFIPYCTGEDDVRTEREDYWIHVGNNYFIAPYDPLDGEGTQMNPHFHPFCSGSVPQPYLCFIIKKVLESIGYNLVYNAIAEHPVLKNLYIVHGFQTLYFAKMLPGWTVVEFFSKIEEWLNCQFIIDPYDKTVKLMFQYQADDNENGITSIEIEDEYTTESDNDNEKTVNNSNVAYSLDSEEYYQYMYIDKNIKNKAKEVDTWALPELIRINDTSEGGFEYILKPSDTSDRFITYILDGIRTLKKADSFRPLDNNPDSDEIDIELDIIPAAMKYTYLRVLSTYYDRFWIQIPIAGDYDPLIDSYDDPEESDPDNDPINIQSLIEGETELSKEQSYSKMRLAIYSGLQEMDAKEYESSNRYPMNRYPIAYVEALAEYFEATKQIRYFGEKEINPFRLYYLNNQIYSKSDSIDTSKIYKLKFTNKGKANITAKFIANNKSFRCIKHERTVTHKGFDRIVRGEFYAYN